MRPLKLEFCGINSFSEPTVIDFESLTKSGIFGIFGDTGSGKSTILDCISFALFGDVERSKSKTDIINYHCEKAEVTFTFDILNEGTRKIYTVTRSIKNDKYGTHKAALYCKDGEQEVCIAEKTQNVEAKIKEIIGVDADDFRKCIAVPQGEFAQFVKSSPSERVKLIERLFALERYGDDLKKKMADRQAEIDSQYSQLFGRLSTYENVTDKIIREKKSYLRVKKHYLKDAKSKKTAAEKRLEKVKALAEKRRELDKIREELKALELEKEKMEELRADLKILPVCRQVRAASAELEKCTEAHKKLLSDLSGCEKRRDEAKAQIEVLEKQIQSRNFDGEISMCEQRSAVFNALKGKPEQLKKYQRELDAKRAEYKEAEGKRKSVAAKKAAAEAEVAECQRRFDEYSVGLDTLINVNLKGAILRGEYASRLGWFTDFRAKTEVYEDDSPLYMLVQSEVEGQIKDYKLRLSDLKDIKTTDINAQIKDLQAQNEEREKRLKALEEAKRKVSAAENQLTICDTRLEQLKLDGETLRANADGVKAELCQSFGENCTDYAAAIRDNEQKLNTLKEERKRLCDNLERLKNSENEAIITVGQLTVMVTTADGNLKAAQQNLASLVQQSGLESAERCISLAEKFSSEADEEALAKFDKKLAELNIRLGDYEKIEGIEEATAEALNAAYSERNESNDEYETAYKDVTRAEQQIEELSKKLEEKKAIEQDFNRVKSQRDLMSQLKEALKNNRFLEFIATEYLCDISSLASSMLLKLTDGRYFLKYQDNTFNVGDNFDCGNLRGVNTLSGGETFLVSLSLALSLSQTICSKSLRSIEFFFLDEGFGTLDANLLDTVMNALEKLKSSNFTIGVISHVEELKHRIDSKITVIKATESHGSTVQVSI